MCFKYLVSVLFSNHVNVSIFHPLEVVGRGSETQLQIGKNLGFLKANLSNRNDRRLGSSSFWNFNWDVRTTWVFKCFWSLECNLDIVVLYCMS